MKASDNRGWIIKLDFEFAGGAVPEYHIRVQNEDRYSASLIVDTTQWDDHAAIKAVSKLAEGAPFEVWHELVCIHGLASDRPLRRVADWLAGEDPDLASL